MLSSSQLLLLSTQSPADTTLARRATREAAAYAQRDRGRLWAVPLNTPLLIVDPATRRAVSGVRDSAGVMVRAGGFYEAVVPAEVQLANTSLAGGGAPGRWC